MNDIRGSNAQVVAQTDFAINGSYSALLTKNIVCCLRDMIKFIENCIRLNWVGAFNRSLVYFILYIESKPPL